MAREEGWFARSRWRRSCRLESVLWSPCFKMSDYDRMWNTGSKNMVLHGTDPTKTPRLVGFQAIKTLTWGSRQDDRFARHFLSPACLEYLKQRVLVLVLAMVILAFLSCYLSSGTRAAQAGRPQASWFTSIWCVTGWNGLCTLRVLWKLQETYAILQPSRIGGFQRVFLVRPGLPFSWLWLWAL